MTRRTTRSALLARTALASTFALAVAAATPALAQSTNAGTVTSVNTNGGGVAFSGATSNTGGADTSTITLGGSRSVLDWNGFNLTSGDTLNFVFGGRGDIVLNRVNAGSATIDGALNGYIATVGGANGGNVWFTSADGVVFGANARVNVGGLLATTGSITNTDFLDGDMNFGFAATPGSSVSVLSGAQLRAYGGTLALVAPSVSTAAGSSITDQSGDKDADVLFGAADQFTITFAADTEGDLDLFSWSVPAGQGSNAVTPLSIAGTTTAGNVYLAAVSRNVAGATVNVTGSVTANGAVASEDGKIVLVAGGGITGKAASALAGSTVRAGAWNLQANGDVTVSAGGDLTLDVISGGRDVTLSSGGFIGRYGSDTGFSVGRHYSVTAADVGGGVWSPVFAGAVPHNFTVVDTAGGAYFGWGGKTVSGDLSVTTLNGGGLTVNGDLTSTGGNITLAGAGGLILQSNLTVGGGKGIHLSSSNGGISQMSGAITGGTLTANGLGVLLSSAGNNIATLGASSGTSQFVLYDTGGLNVVGNVSSAAGALTLNAGTGALSIGNVAVSAGNLITLTGGSVSLTGTTLTGGNNLNVTGATTLGGVNLTTTGTQNYMNAVTLSGDASLTGSMLSFYGAVNGGYNLTVGGSIGTGFQGAVGNTSALASLTTNGEVVISGGSVRTTGAQSYNGAVTLGANATLTSTGAGAISFNSLLNGRYDLAVNTSGQTKFWMVGNMTSLNSITTDAGGTTLLTGSMVATARDQTYGDTLQLGGNAILTGEDLSYAAVNGSGNDLTLNFSGNTAINGTTTTGVRNLATGGGGTTSLGGVINTTGTQTYNDAVTLVGNATLASSGADAAGDIAFGGTVDGNYSLIVNTAGATTFQGGVGLTTALGSLRTDSAGSTFLNAGAIRTSTTQSYGDAVVLGTNTSLSSTSGSAITLAAVDGAYNLGVNTTGATTFAGAVGATTALASLTTNAGGSTVISGGTIRTTGDQTYGDGIVLGAHATLTGEDVSYASVTGSGRDLTLNFSGLTTINGANTTGVRNLATGGGGTTSLAGAINTTGTQTYNDAVSLGGNTTLLSAGSGAAGNVTFNNTVDGAQELTVNTTGATTFAGAVGATTALTSLITDAGGTTALNADVTATGAVTFDDALALGGAGLRKVRGGTASFQAVDAGTADGLSVDVTGQVLFNGGIGAGGALDQLAVRADHANFSANANVGAVAASISTGHFQFYNNTALRVGSVDGIDGVTAAGTVSLTSGSFVLPGSGGDIVLDQAVTGSVVQLETAYGSILGTGLVSGGDVSLYGGAGVGASGARVRTAATRLAASSQSGGAWLDEVDGVLLNLAFSEAATGFDLRAGGTIEAGGIRTTSGDIVLTSTGGDITTAAGGSYLEAGGASDIRLTASNGAIRALGAANFIADDLYFTAQDFTGDLFSEAGMRETGDVSITDTLGGLSLGAVSAAGDLTVTVLNGGGLDVDGVLSSIGGDVTLRAGGDLRFGALGRAVGGNVMLSTDYNFHNLRGADAVSATGRWLIYSAGPDGNTFGGLDSGNTAVWGRDLDDGPVSQTGNRYVFAVAPTATFTSTGGSKTYGDSGAGVMGYTVSGLHAGVAGAFQGDTLATAFSGSAALSSAGAAERATVAGGPYTVTISAGDLASLAGYGMAFNSAGQIVVTPKALTATVTANDKTYDGTRNATGTISVNGVLSGDTVGHSGGTFTFADRNAGADKVVTVSGVTLTGADAGNYTLTLPADVMADIFKKAITATAAAGDKTYDGTRTGSGTVTLAGVIDGDTVGASAGTWTFADKNAGADKVVTISGVSLTGADAGNYSVTIPATALADIFKKAITATAAAGDKTYDGTRTGSGTVTLAGVVDGDTVGTSAGTWTFADKNAGADKVVTVSGVSLTGADAGNYSVTIPATALADIFQKAITATATAGDKTYDGTRTGSGTVTLAGVVDGDTVGTSAGTWTFADKNAGADKVVTLSGVSLTGADAGNYSVTIPATALADIFKKAITATAAAGDKTYDGTRTGSGTVTLAGVVDGDTVGTSAGTWTFADKNAGADKVVTVSGVSLTGADAGNYSVTIPATALADIFQKAITASVAANDKTYDGNRNGTGTVTLAGVVDGDAVGTSAGTWTFADKNAGADKIVTISGVSLTGGDAGNYTVTIPATALADILRKELTATVIAGDKTYDGTTAGSGTVILNGVVDGDAVTGGATFTFADKNAGTAKTVHVTGATLTGADAANYSLTVPASVLADIARRAITVTANPADKQRGDTDPPLTWTLTAGSLVDGDSLTGALERASGEAVGRYLIGQGGLEASSNYDLVFTPAWFEILAPSSDPSVPTAQAYLQAIHVQTPQRGGQGDLQLDYVDDATDGDGSPAEPDCATGETTCRAAPSAQ